MGNKERKGDERHLLAPSLAQQGESSLRAVNLLARPAGKNGLDRQVPKRRDVVVPTSSAPAWSGRLSPRVPQAQPGQGG
eukprot:COSAG01_NODE_4450_length_5008_cov_2.475657_2_plen_79_part_00